MPGLLALIGGGEFQPGCTFDAALLEASGGSEVAVVPTAAAYEHPERLVEQAAGHFEALGAKVRHVAVHTRPDAADPELVAAVRDARLIYLPGSSPMHLRSVLKDSPVWEALVAAWDGGAVLAGSSAGARALCDPMVDPRGGAFTLGLGLVAQVAVIPHHDHWSEEKAKRTLDLAPAGLPIVGIDEQTAAIRDPDGAWRPEGAGEVVVFVDGKPAGLDALP
jgi:cyanophycinase